MSRNIDILDAIKNGEEYTKESCSRVETILKAIANHTENLINISTATIEGGALQRFAIPLESVKGKTISASAFVQNKSTAGNGARIRIDVTNDGTVNYAMGNDIATGTDGISKVENVSIPATATKVELSVQSYSGNIGNVTFTRFMVNIGSTVKSYLPYINGEAISRCEQLLLDIKNSDTTDISARSRIESLLVAIANGTLDEFLDGKNLFNEDLWRNRETVENRECLVFNGFFAATTGNKIGNPLVIATDLPSGTYTVKGKFKKTDNFNALAGMNESNVRTAFGSFKDNFTEDAITFTTTEKLKYLYLDTGSASANGYCEIETLMFGKNLGTGYSQYCFSSEIETAFYEAFRND